MAVTKQAIQLLEAAVRRMERAAGLLNNEGQGDVSFEVNKHCAEIELLVLRVKSAEYVKRGKSNGA